MLMPVNLIEDHLRDMHGIKQFEKIPKPNLNNDEHVDDLTQGELFERIYKGAGQTSIDRLIASMASINKLIVRHAGRMHA